MRGKIQLIGVTVSFWLPLVTPDTETFTNYSDYVSKEVYFAVGDHTCIALTLLHSERPKLHTILAFLSAIGLTCQRQGITSLAGSGISSIKYCHVFWYLVCFLTVHREERHCTPWNNHLPYCTQKGHSCMQFWPF